MHWEKFHLVELNILIKISWKQPKSSLLLTFRLYQRPSSEEAGTRSSSSGSWRNKLVSSQESGCAYDHAAQENHVISCSAASVIDRESDRSTRWIKEAVHIRKEGPRSMNRDEGSYQLSHTYDRFLGSTLTCCAKNRKKT